MKKKHVIWRSLGIGLLCLVTLITAASYYMKYLNDKISEEIKHNLREVSKSNGDAIYTGLQYNLDSLGSLAAYIERGDTRDEEKIAIRLELAAKAGGSKRIGVADIHGNAYTSDGHHVDVKDRSYFKEAMSGKLSVTSPLNDLIGGEKIMVYAVPLHQDDKISGVLFNVKSTDEVANSLLVNTFDSEGFSMLADQDGKIILRKGDKALRGISNVKQLKVSDDISSIKELGNEHGVLSFMYGNEEMFMAYEPLKYNGWYVVSVVPASVVATQIASFSHMAVFTWVVIILVFMLLILYIYITYRRNSRQMEKILFEDTLTHCDNFNRFKMQVEKLLSGNHGKAALVEYDIQDFKMFNKLYGYTAGDELLREIARISTMYCRNHEYSARMSDDRFVILWQEDNEKAVRHRIHTLYNTLMKSYERNDIHAKFHLCFGVYMINEEDQDVMKCLDLAIYAKNHIKKDRDQFISFYDNAMYDQIIREREMEERMELALNNREFVVYLQPKVNVEEGKVMAAEALVRWNDPNQGMISPGTFIPLFEKNGFLEQLDMYVFETVCRTLSTWRKQGKKTISISVNISKSYMFLEGFGQRLKTIVDQYEVPYDLIELEITESVIFQNSHDLIAIIKELKSYGFRISMDDFGSGYSSLNMLKEIPIDIIKLDQVFFRNSEDSQTRARLIVEGILQMVELLHIDAVAEGIETKEESEFLKRVHCPIAQGFYFYRPMPIAEVEKILNT